jgi:hypothetical protein
MKLSHQEVELLANVIKQVNFRDWELDRVDDRLVTLQRRLEQYHETTLQLEGE